MMTNWGHLERGHSLTDFEDSRTSSPTNNCKRLNLVLGKGYPPRVDESLEDESEGRRNPLRHRPF